MAVSFETYEQVALEDDEQWELVCGRLRKKPGMTIEHNDVMHNLGFELRRQLDPAEYTVRINTGRTNVIPGSFYVPDVFVVPRSLVEHTRTQRPRRLEYYEDPLPLVVEVWSRSTGEYDVSTKFPEYKRRGDREIWRLHPYERTLTAWRRQLDGSYSESVYTEGTITPVALPGVTIELAALFA
jgi:Uma2 family endonuclease